MRALHDRASRGGSSPKKTPAQRTGPSPGGADALVCRACGQLVTRRRARIEVQGSHEHRFMNPGGFVYRIGCFGEALGCFLVGPSSTEYPWFPGFVWRCAHCAGCGVQLGWQFRSPGEAGFFGLILDRLVDQPSAGDAS